MSSTRTRTTAIWEAVFGASPDALPEIGVEFAKGSEWDRPGSARVEIWGDDDQPEGSAVVTPATLEGAYNLALIFGLRDACTGGLFDIEDVDVCVASAILQIAVLGEVIV